MAFITFLYLCISIMSIQAAASDEVHNHDIDGNPIGRISNDSNTDTKALLQHIKNLEKEIEASDAGKLRGLTAS